MTLEDRRKVLHMAAGLGAVALRYLGPGSAVLLGIALVIHNVVVFPRLFPALVRPGRDPGLLLYPVSVLAAILVFRDRPELAAMVWGILAFGDGLANLIGRRLPGLPLPWNPDKTWGGLAAFVVAGTVAGVLLYLFVADDAWSPGVAFLAGAAASLAAGFAESLRVRLDDNVRVVSVAIGILALAVGLDPDILTGRLPAFLDRGPEILVLSVALAFGAHRVGFVSRSGALVGAVITGILGVLGGWGALAVFATFFGAGSLATGVGRRQKARRGLDQADAGRRGAAHALANVSIAVGLVVWAAGRESSAWPFAGFVAALATAGFDTVATELGQLWGRHPVLPLSGRRVPPGTPGAVSWQGSLTGLVTASGVAAVGAGTGLYPWSVAWVIPVGAALGAGAESVAGASVWVRERMDGHLLNFLNTAFGAGVALGLARAFGSADALGV